jgi:nucleotide-binding universal stress UspA family protein
LLAAEEEHTKAHLQSLVEDVAQSGVTAEMQSPLGNPSDEILRMVEKLDPRLLVLATHGRSGLTRWRYGSVASRLIREAPVPTCVIGPMVLEKDVEMPGVKRILVPLDGSSMAEAALQPAAELAQALGGTIVITRVVAWAAQPYLFGEGVDVATLEKELESAGAEYLERIQDRLRPEVDVEVRLLRGVAAEALMNSIEERGADLVVMTTHSRTGLARAVLGSVADRLLQSPAPVLFVRPEGVATVRTAQRGRYCHNCGRASAYVQILEDDRCLRCGQLLHACSNCVYHDGIACMLQRPEAHEVYPGKTCAYFQFRESEQQEIRKPAAMSTGG